MFELYFVIDFSLSSSLFDQVMWRSLGATYQAKAYNVLFFITYSIVPQLLRYGRYCIGYILMVQKTTNGIL